MRRLPVIAVTVVLAILLGAALATAVVTASSPAASAAPEPAPAAPAAPAAPGGPAAPGASGSPGAQAAPGAPGSPAAPGAPAAAPTSVAFLGDGYTAATPEGGRGPANYTALIAQRDGWRTVTNDSVFGSGYVADPALGTRVQKILAGGPQLVVVTAGRADDASSPAEVGTAATALYQDLKTRLPQAKVIVIGPMWLGPDVPQRMTAVRDAIRDAATGAQLPFVDPIAAGWFADGKDVGPSGLVPNDAGHTRLAQLVDDALKQSGAVPR